MTATSRRYDIDWIRVIAIGLLLLYHIAIGFQPWGIMIGFITSDRPWPSLWIPMGMLNIWRIPLLFFVSGMGVYFAIRQRNWTQLIVERARRILLPYLFGMVCIFPISVYIWQKYNHFDLNYSAHPGHLWFLGNIFAYVVLLTPFFFYLKAHENGKVAGTIKRILSNPLGLILVILVFIAEALIVRPVPYELYAMTWHGFFLGLLAFFFGFCFVLSGIGFWEMILKGRWVFLAVAAGLFTLRLWHFNLMTAPAYLLVTESDCWIFSVFAFGYRYLNHPSQALTYLSQAAYPVYILHMIFLFLGSMLIFPLDIPAPLQFVLVLVFTVAGCFGMFEIIKRVKYVRELFGMSAPVKNPKSTL